MKVINKKLGNDFESELCEVLSAHGYWVHNFASKKTGQPADIIAVKNSKAYLIDAKECTKDIFKLIRVEENQKNAMDLWLDCGNTLPCFALNTSKGVYMVSYSTIKELMHKGKKQLSIEDINKYGARLETWLRIWGN